MSQIPSIVLVDGTGYLFRAFHALPPLTNSQGQPTGATYGLLSMLRKLKRDYPTSQHIIVFDAPGPTFRDKLFAEYKAGRAAMPEALAVQIKPTYALVEAMGLPLLVVPGVEADDVIGTLAVQAQQAKHQVLICTSDKDMAQLINADVSLFNSMSGDILDTQGAQKKFGVLPGQMIDYLTLVGDAIDNIPGVSKVGPKTARKWLEEYGNLENILANKMNIPGKVGENLRAQIEQIPLSKALATIDCKVQLPMPLEEMKTRELDIDALKDWYQRLEYKEWLAEITSPPDPSASSDIVYDLIIEKDALEDWLARLGAAGTYACCVITEDDNYMTTGIAGIALATDIDGPCYIPMGHQHLDATTSLSPRQVLDMLAPLFQDQNLCLVGHNLKFAINVLAGHGISCQNQLYDIMLASYVLNSVGTKHTLEALAQAYLNADTVPLETVLGTGRKKHSFSEISPHAAASYAAKRPVLVLQVQQKLQEKLMQVEPLKRLFDDMEMALLPVLSVMERQGALVDADNLRAQSISLAERLDDLQAKAWELAGHSFNLASTQQLREVFYNELRLPVLRKTPKGAPSTAEPVLVELAIDYELPRLIMEHRSLAKLKLTYTDKLPEQIDSNTKRIHTSFHQAVASTGRLSSADPNLQNIPARTEAGRMIRRAFIAPSGQKLVSADYSQIELRIMAHFSNDAGLLSAFQNNQDIHRRAAADIRGIALEAVTDDQRRDAKAVNFGLIYGMSAFGLSRQLGISRPAAQDYIDRYFERYPGVKRYMDDVSTQAKSTGYVETLFGRRLYLPDIQASNGRLKQAAERAAINAPMQGTAADIIKRAMIQIHQWLDYGRHPKAKMVLQVHDELLFEVETSWVPEFIEGVQTRMSEAAILAVPLVVNVGVGDNWVEAH